MQAVVGPVADVTAVRSEVVNLVQDPLLMAAALAAVAGPFPTVRLDLLQSSSLQPLVAAALALLDSADSQLQNRLQTRLAVSLVMDAAHLADVGGESGLGGNLNARMTVRRLSAVIAPR